MIPRWYTKYFTSEFWDFAQHEYTATRTSREVAYLDGILATHAPGKRILDVGCGVGRHAIPLAMAGYQVTGVDVSSWALDQARASADAAGVKVAWCQMDVLAARSGELPEVDAAICVQAFGWGDDGEQLRLLRTLHSCVCLGGLLVLDHSNLTAILRAYAPSAHLQAGGDRFDLSRSFDPLTGRSRGEVQIRYSDGRSSRIHDDVRLYQPYEVRRLLLAAGFDVERIDANFHSGDRPRSDSRYIQFVARRAAPVMSWPSVSARMARGVDALDLRWSPDEAEYVQSALDLAWNKVVDRDMGLRSDQARYYALEDPFGGRMADLLAKHFHCRVEPDMVCAGAGSTGLLRDLGALPGLGLVIHRPVGYPELPRAARQSGAETVSVDLVGNTKEFVAALDSRRPALVVIDRPGIEGELCHLGVIKRLASLTAQAGAVLVVDEARATYAGPQASAVRLVADLDNLVVVRSFSKGYCCGGLRVGFAVSSPDVAEEVRVAATPLAVSEFALAVALRLLEQGDIFGPMRRRIAEVKPVVIAALCSLGLPIVAGDKRLPWVTVEATGSTLAVLRDHRVEAKYFDFVASGLHRELLRISVPLSKSRLHTFLSAVGRPNTTAQ